MTAPATPTTPFVTVLVPCRNEGRFIAPCLASILENGYPTHRLEVLVVDGASTDDTADQVRRFAASHPSVRLIDNPRRVTPVALNLGITSAKGAYILWMSAHNTYLAGYIRECVAAAERFGVANVGGGIETVARDTNLMAPFVVAALTHRFGVGSSAFRLASSEPQWVDTVFGGCYRRDVFDRVGLFNEALTRGQDMEFNLRLKRAGLRTLLLPTVRSIYHARSRYLEFLRHNWTNGVWAILPFRYVEHPPVGLRHLIPMTFAGALVTALVLATTVPHGIWALAALGSAYILAATAASVDVALRFRNPLYLLVMPWMFLSLHLSYGGGSLWGGAQLGGAWLRKRVTGWDR
jgi:glycosyltransferase involved in cell wall biosynthesis